jgi:hypothetical protein
VRPPASQLPHPRRGSRYHPSRASTRFAARAQYLHVIEPAAFRPDKRYPLVVDNDGTQAAPADPFYVKPLRAAYRTERATSREIADYMREKYPVDTARQRMS